MGLFNIFRKNENKIDAFAYSDKLFDDGKYLEAIKVLDIIIESYPTNWYSYFRKGKCFQYLNEFDKAINEFEKGSQFEDNMDLNRGLGECYLMKENWLKGKKFLFKTYNLLLELEKQNNRKLNNDKSNILNNLAIALYNLDEIQDAIKCSEEGIKYDPMFSGNYRILGTILLAYDKTKGIQLLTKAVSLGDSMARTILNDIL